MPSAGITIASDWKSGTSLPSLAFGMTNLAPEKFDISRYDIIAVKKLHAH